ncbi:MAG: NUDIX hydrolase, partial [Anaerolineales bacterium]
PFRAKRRSSEALVHQRVRAAVIFVEDDRLLLVKHVDPLTGNTWWVPPGGGMEPEDGSILACAEREVFEETGLRVDVGKLVYLREFLEEKADVHHLELYFLSDSFSGAITLDNVAGNGPDEDYIRDVAWLAREDLHNHTVFPEHLADGFWEDLNNGFPEVIYLGVSAD